MIWRALTAALLAAATGFVFVPALGAMLVRLT
jgi:hypothetical protein